MWDGKGTCWTRTGHEVYAPSFFVDALPKGTPLDGELWMGRGNFQSVMSVCRRQDKPEAEQKHAAVATMYKFRPLGLTEEEVLSQRKAFGLNKLPSTEFLHVVLDSCNIPGWVRVELYDVP